MRHSRFHSGKSPNLPQRQQGLVLLIALIVLVAMTLAGIGMMRSVDTGTLISGNLAFKQAATQASDRAMNDGFNALMTVTGNNTDKQILRLVNGSACPVGATAALCPGGVTNILGYSPSTLNACEVTNTCATVAQQQWWNVAANWAAAPSVNVTDANGGTVATVSYLIHRMCTAAGPTAGNTCQTSATGGGGGSGCSKAVGGSACFASSAVFYRITARSQGPRNTTSYTQTMVLIGD
ncbi:hypothetical protein OYT1_ch2709 [Ferriphaselus amnicola]|uniref:Type IV pilus assembly protein PilX n=1 Tax=Ferriphaselus amnicola TaxID=1188319 RepID=A0A2Z6GG72_9PROT|nr:hypothetical protein [Ferriphaselus amnicola]BBE52215.1 hypothetical protein OYT1_ch2709 [Ferriphaselus amnicola]